MIVYPDLIFFQAFFLHFCAYSLSLFSLDLVRPRRILWIGSLVSAATSVLTVLPGIPSAIPLFVGGGVTVLILRGKTVRGTIRNSLTGLLIVFLVVAGFLPVSGILFSLSLFGTSAGGYFILSFWEGLFSIGFSSGLLWLFLRIRAKKKLRSALYDCTLLIENRILRFRCYGDSGNLLADPVTGFPVVILEYSELRKFFGASFPRPLTYEFAERFADRARVVPYRTVSGGGKVLSAFLPEDFRINGSSRKVVIAVTEGFLEENGRFSGIIGPELMEGVPV